ncbi:uncharacterized protein CFAP97D2 [Notamacropus eugenii]|uniref:uncharacterized protein CFAP97D2 n=1 Tax=Notamacropus eugenii TaxID=9315 RepID=UPI003B682BBB
MACQLPCDLLQTQVQSPGRCMKVCVKVTPLCEEVRKPIKQFKMHRSCHPVFNYFDNIFNQKSWERAYRDHRRKIEAAKAVVDCGTPLIYNHIQLNLKKFKKETEKLRFIERENRWLMERIAFIMRTQDACDILNDYKQRWDRREKELRRIDRENRNFQERLASCLPWYRLQKWCEDWEVEESFSDTIPEIPQIPTQTCCCSHIVHTEIRPRRTAPRKRLLKLRQKRVEAWDSDVEDEPTTEDTKQKQDDTSESKMEEKTKIITPKKEEEVVNKLVKEEEKRKFELNEEQMEEIGIRLLADVRSRVAKLEVELETESKMLREVKTMIKMKEEEEAAGQVRKKDPRVKKHTLKEKEGKESKSKEDTESKSTEKAESKPVEETESKPVEETDSKSLKETESRLLKETESRPSKDTESRPSKDTESEPSKDTESGPSKDTESGPSKDTESEPSKDTESGPSKDTESEPSKDTESGPSKDTESGPSKDTESGPSKDTESGPSKDTESGPSKDTESGPSKETESGPSKETESGPLKETESGSLKETESRSLKETESKTVQETESKPTEEKEEKPESVESEDDIEAKSKEETEGKKVTLQEPEKVVQDKPPEEEAVVSTAGKEEDTEQVTLERKDSQLPEASQEE